MYPVPAQEEERLEMETIAARPRSAWGLLLVSLIALVLVGIAAPHIRQQRVRVILPAASAMPVRQMHKAANLVALPIKSATYLVYMPLMSLPQPAATDQISRWIAPTATATPTVEPSPTPTATPTPLPTPDGQARQVRVPILMYHYISEPPPDADLYRLDLSVTPQNFEQQLRYLVENGYTTITLTDLVYHLTLGYPMPERPVILTFDDGYRDHFLQAYRLLRRYHSVGTFFLVTGFIDDNRPDYLTWGQVRVMHQGGMAFGAHSYTHPDLRGQSVDYLVWQIVGSQQAIAERIEEPVRFFSYPSGSYDQQVIDVLASAGFWAAVTTEQGSRHTSEALFELPRIRIRGEDTLEQFAAKLDYR